MTSPTPSPGAEAPTPPPPPAGQAAAPVAAPAPRARRAAAASLLQAVIQWLLAILIFFLANALSCQRFARLDSTRSHVSSLSEITRNTLKAVDEKSRIVVAFVHDSPLREKTWRLAQAYADERPNLVFARQLDPVRDPETARDLAKRFRHEFKDNAVLVIKGKRLEVVPESALQLTRQMPDGTTKAIGFTGEDAITAALRRLLEPTPPVVYLITGKGPWPATPNGNGSDTLRALLPRYNASIKELSLDGLAAIPADATALLLANPRYDLTGAEVRLLREFWENRKGGLFVLLNPDATTPNLDAFLKFNGILVDRRTVIRPSTDPTATAPELSVAARFLPGAKLTDPFVNADSRLPGSSGFLVVEKSRDDLRVRGVRTLALLESLPGYWGESNPSAADVSFDPAEDAGGPLTLVAAVERAAIEDERLRVPAARLVVSANPHLLDPNALLQVNVDFFFSCLNWMMDRQDMIGIGPRQPVLYQAAPNQRGSRTLHLILLAGLPALALMLAWLVHQRRRS